MTAAQKRAFAKMRAGLARWRRSRGRRPSVRRNPKGWTIPAYYGQDSVKRKRAAKARSIARSLPRGPGGRFLKRSSRKRRSPSRSVARTAPRSVTRRRPRRAAAAPRRRRYHTMRGRRGRFATRYTPAYRKRALRWNRKRNKSGKRLRAVRRIPKGHLVAGLVRLNPRTGEMQVMPSAIVANPRRRRRRRRSSVARNPRRRSRGRRRSRVARNPRLNVKSMLSNAVAPTVAGFGGGALAGFIDAKVLPKKRLLQALAKLGVSIVGARVLRRKPQAAAAFAGAVMGSIGYGFGLKMAGGMVANTKGEAVAGLADLAADDSELAAALSDASDIGDLVEIADMADGDQVEELVED